MRLRLTNNFFLPNVVEKIKRLHLKHKRARAWQSLLLHLQPNPRHHHYQQKLLPRTWLLNQRPARINE